MFTGGWDSPKAGGRAVFLGSFCVVLIVFVILRETGLPWRVASVHHLGPILAQYIGLRRVLTYSNGSVACVEMFRSPDINHTSHVERGLSHLVWGRYFDPKGREFSRVKDGCGILTAFHENGVPKELAFYEKGALHGPAVAWYANGQVRSISSFPDNSANKQMTETELKSGLQHTRVITIDSRQSTSRGTRQ